MAQVIQTTFRLKRGNSARWIELNPILQQGEPGFELDTGKFKIGNGVDSWINLKYVGEHDSCGSGNQVEYSAGTGLTLIDGTFAINLAKSSHGLVAINGALQLNLATENADGAMSKEDKAFINNLKKLDIVNTYVTKNEIKTLQDIVDKVEYSCTWGEMI